MSTQRGPAPPPRVDDVLDPARLDAFELLPDAVVVLGHDSRVVYCSTLAARLLRRSRDDVVGRPARDVVRLTDAKGLDWWAMLESASASPRLHPRVPPTDLTLATYDGRSRPVTLTASRLGGADGRLAGVVVVLRRAERRHVLGAARSDLVSTVSHEIRSPLTSVKGFTRTLLAKWDRFTDEQKLTMLRTVNEDADRVTRLLGELLDVSRIDAGRLHLRRQMVALPDVVERVCSRAEVGDDAGRVATRLADDLPRLYADPDKLEQILTNLVENALKYSNGGVVVSAVAGPDEVRVTVADDGPGVPSAHRALVFTRFFRSPDERTHGTGLGLYISKGLVEAHGGRIWVDGDPGAGARFQFTLPRGGLELAGISLEELRAANAAGAGEASPSTTTSRSGRER